jgi:hypothetical protein
VKEKDALLLRKSAAPGFAPTLHRLRLTYRCLVAETPEEADGHLSCGPVPVGIVWDRSDAGDSLAYCRALHLSHPESKIILISGGSDRLRLIDAFNQDCLFRCLMEPVSTEALDEAIRVAIRRFEMERVESMLVRNAAAIDRQVLSTPYWLYRLQTAASVFVRAFVGSVGVCVITGVVVLLAGIGVFLLLYYVKSALGFDIFEDRHLKDCF